MNSPQADIGTIVARAMGFIFLWLGVIGLADYVVHLRQMKTVPPGTSHGWQDYNVTASMGTAERAIHTVFHDVYYTISPSFSPIASAVFILVGIGHLISARLVGRLLSGGKLREPR